MKDERGFISIRKRMMVIFAVLITVTGIGIAGLFVATALSPRFTYRM